MSPTDPTIGSPPLAEAVDDQVATGAFTPRPTMSMTGPPQSNSVEPAPNELIVVPGYEIIGQLGRGGMGVVYHARETKLNRPVALKMVLGHDRVDRKALIRFLAEAEAAAAIDHPNVVRVYRYGESNGQPFMALEYLSGGSLAGKLKDEGKLSIRDSVETMAQVARGVAAAHEKGIVHRDLKPANVLLDANGQPKVADFGLARRGPSDLTQTGTVMGTPAYMSPEQAKGETKFVGPSADVWALGVMLYECLIGERPFAGDDTWAVIQKVLNIDPARPRTLNPRIPRDLELICLKCLAKGPQDRYPTAAELADDLDRFARGEPVAVRQAGLIERTVKWARRKPTLAGLYAAGLAAMVLLAVGSVIAWMWRNEANARASADSARAEAIQSQSEAEAARTQAEAAKAGEEKARREAESSRDRETQAHLATKKAREELADQDALRKVDLAQQAVEEHNALRAIRLLDSVDPARRQWEWRHVARLAQPEHLRMRADGTISNVAVTKDGRRAFASAEEGVVSWDLHNGSTMPGYQGHKASVRQVMLHPDGTRAISGSGDGMVHIWEIANQKKLHEIKSQFHPEIARFAVSPDAKILAIGTAAGPITLWEIDSGKQVGELKGHRFLVFSLVFTSDGRLVSSGQDQTVRLWNVTTKQEQAKLSERSPVWSLGVGRSSIYAGTESGHVFRAPLPEATESKWTKLESFQAHTSRVWKIALNTNGSRLVTTGMDRTARVWALRNGVRDPALFQIDPELALDQTAALGSIIQRRPLRILGGHFSDVTDAQFVEGLDTLVTAADWNVRLFVQNREVNREIALASSFGFFATNGGGGLAFSHDSQSVVGIDQGRARWFTVDPVKQGLPPVAENLAASGPTTAVALSPDGRWIAEARLKTLRVKEVSSPDGKDWPNGPEPITSCAFAGNHERLVTCDQNGAIAFWNTSTGQKIWSTQGPKFFGSKSHVACSPEGKTIASAGTDRMVRLWSAADGKPLGVLSGHTHAVNYVEFSPDGTRLASASSDNTSRVWDVASMREVLRMRTRDHYIHSVTFSPDGKRIAAGSGDGAITIYDSQTGQDALVLKGHNGPVLGLRFSPDGAWLASSSDGKIRLWESPLDIKVQLPPGANEPFDPRGRRPKK